MDLSELIKCYNMEHKSLFTAFAVSCSPSYLLSCICTYQSLPTWSFMSRLFSRPLHLSFACIYRTFLPLLYIEREGNGTEEDIYLCLSAPLPLPFG